MEIVLNKPLIILTTTVFVILRLCQMLAQIRSRRAKLSPKSLEKKGLNTSHSIMVVLGSGGHTAEMLTIISDILTNSTKSQNLIYVAGKTDRHSIPKALTLHENNNFNTTMRNVSCYSVPRAREVGQGWISSCYSSLYTTIFSIQVVVGTTPDLILCNGPGTCVIICVIAFVMRLLTFRQWGKIVYVESFARVKTLSMSGKILYQFADRFLVQWDFLHKEYPLSEYYGRLA